MYHTSLSIHLSMGVRLLPRPSYGKYCCNEDVFFSIMVFSEYMPSNGIAGSYGSFIPRFLRNLHTVLHSGCINLQFHQHSKRVSFSLHPLQHLLFIDFFDDGHSDWCEVIPHCSFDLHLFNNGQC